MSDSDKKINEPAPLKILTKDYGEFGRIEVLDISENSEVLGSAFRSTSTFRD